MESAAPEPGTPAVRVIQIAAYIATILLLGRMAGGFFIADDFNLLFLGKWVENPLSFFIHDHFEGVFFRPFGMAAYWSLYRLFQWHYWGYALAMAAVHLANGALLQRLVRRSGASTDTARLAAAFFWLAPAGVATAIWASDVYYVLAVLFLLMAFLAWQSIRVGEHIRWTGWLQLLLWLGLAVASHDIALAGAASLVVLEFIWHRQSDGSGIGGPQWKRLWLFLLGFGVAYFTWRYSVLGLLVKSYPSSVHYTPLQRLGYLARFLPESFAFRADSVTPALRPATLVLIGGLVLLALTGIRKGQTTPLPFLLLAGLGLFIVQSLPAIAFGLDRMADTPDYYFWRAVGGRILYLGLPGAAWTLAVLATWTGSGRTRHAAMLVSGLLLAGMAWTGHAALSAPVLADMRANTRPMYRGAEAFFGQVDYEDATTLVVSGMPEPHRHYLSTMVGALLPNRGRWLIVAEEASRHYSAYIYPYPKERLAPLALADDGLRNPSGFGRIMVIKTDPAPPRAELCKHPHVRIIETEPNTHAWGFHDRTEAICATMRPQDSETP